MKKIDRPEKVDSGEGNTITAKLLSREFICKELIFINTHMHKCMGALMLKGKSEAFFLSLQKFTSKVNLYIMAHQAVCGYLNSHGTKAPAPVHCSHLNAQYTHVLA